MTDPIGTAQERELINYLCRSTASPEEEQAADALLSRIAEVERFCAIMDKTDDEGFSPEIEQELMDLRAALSQHRKL